MDATTRDTISALLLQHLRGELSDVEQATLQAWIAEDPEHATLVERLDRPEGLFSLLQEFDRADKVLDQQLVTAIPSLRDAIHYDDPDRTVPRVHRVHFLKTAWFRYAAAILLLFGSVAYFYFNGQKEKPLVATQPVPVKNDILPGGQRALLTLTDGRTIVLDSAANGQLATQNGSAVIKKDGQVMYGAGQLQGSAVTYNTMSTPKGGQYQLTLIDGTKVWLNAASSITYPTVFTGHTREVKVSGEAYFEVAKNKSAPFIVEAGDEKITVLGTSFNVNRYTDEPASKISLVNGSINVNDQLLKPGQAFVNGKVIKTNTTQDIAWRNGVFDFHDMTIETAMRQIARWYDIEVVYDQPIKKYQLSGEINRAVSLQELVKGLEGLGAHFRLQGRILHISPI